jgi:hypothetical protein
MLCERCQAIEATVHLAAILWPTGERIEHFCDSCYPEAEAARVKQYTPEPVPVALPDVERMTASEYLQFSARAAANGADKPLMHQLNEELKRLPATRHRLGLEMLKMALDSVERGDDPMLLLGVGGCLVNPTDSQKPHEGVELLRKLVFELFDRLLQPSAGSSSSEHFRFLLGLAVIALRKADPQCLERLFEALQGRSVGSGEERRKTIEYVKAHLADADQKRPRRGEE